MKNLSKKILLNLFALAFSTSALASDQWLHVGPLRSGSVTTYVDYQVKTKGMRDAVGGGYEAFATPLWINVSSAYLTPVDKVKAVLVNVIIYKYRGEVRETRQQVYELNLSYAEAGRFTGEVTQPFLLESQTETHLNFSRYETRQELAVSINGVWYKAPVTGHNFSFNMNRTAP